MEVEVIQAMWHEGKPIFPKKGKKPPVIDLPKSEAVYLDGLGRVRIIPADVPAVEAAGQDAEPETGEAGE